jgi:hypothetical protein
LVLAPVLGPLLREVSFSVMGSMSHTAALCSQRNRSPQATCSQDAGAETAGYSPWSPAPPGARPVDIFLKTSVGPELSQGWPRGPE